MPGKGWAEARLMTCPRLISSLSDRFTTLGEVANYVLLYRVDIERYNYPNSHILSVSAGSLDTSVTHPEFASEQWRYITLVGIRGLR